MTTKTVPHDDESDDYLAAKRQRGLYIEYGHLCLRDGTGWLLWSRQLTAIKSEDLMPEIGPFLAAAPDSAAPQEPQQKVSGEKGKFDDARMQVGARLAPDTAVSADPDVAGLVLFLDNMATAMERNDEHEIFVGRVDMLRKCKDALEQMARELDVERTVRMQLANDSQAHLYRALVAEQERDGWEADHTHVAGLLQAAERKIAAARNDALEEAAKCVEYRGQCGVQMINAEERIDEKKAAAWDALQHAFAIRELKGQP